MKQLAVLLLVAALAVPALADVTVTATDQGNGVLRIVIAPGTGTGIRGVALKLERTAGNAELTAANKVTTSGLNTFIDYGFSVPSGFDVGVGHPVANATAAGVATFPVSTFSLCAGWLDQSGNQGAQNGAIQFDVDYDNGTQNTTIQISADTLRGGIVGDNIGTITGLPATVTLQFAQPEVLNGTLVIQKTTPSPAIATHVNGGRTETFVLSGVTASQGGQIQYYVDWGDGNNTGWVTSASLSKVYTYTAAGTYTVTAKARPASNPTAEVSAAPLTLQREPVKYTASFYSTWALFNRPACWAYQRNCRGDADGVGTGGGASKIWVTSNDLNIFLAGYNKPQSNLLNITYGGVPGICADNDRLGTGGGSSKVWVTSSDLNVFLQYYNKTQTNTPVCSNANIHYWTN